MSLNRFGWGFLCLLTSMLLAGCQNLKPMPEGLSYDGEWRPAQSVEFYSDTAWVDDEGKRHLDQEIFDAVMQRISEAQELILLDMFLFNDFMGKDSDPARELSSELTAALIEKKHQRPDIQIVVITDPVNTVYGGYPSQQFESLRAAGIPVVITNLDELRDSNPVYSFIWRLLIRPFGNGPGDTLDNPFGRGQVTVRSYLKLLNFKANHRKVFISDSGDGLNALVTSANPHDGSSAHRNVALGFGGAAAEDLLASENAVLQLSGADKLNWPKSSANHTSDTRLRVVSESRIEDAVLEMLGDAGTGETVDLLMFYLSDRDVVEALIHAHERGAKVRVILDANKDAFGREKNGVPNRPVAAELHEAGIPVRWCMTQGEQCHGKMLLLMEDSNQASLTLGSANYTRRNLDDFNLETNVMLQGPATERAFKEAQQHFNQMWTNEPGRTFSVDYSHFEDDSLIKQGLYRFQEWSGLSTF